MAVCTGAGSSFQSLSRGRGGRGLPDCCCFSRKTSSLFLRGGGAALPNVVQRLSHRSLRRIGALGINARMGKSDEGGSWGLRGDGSEEMENIVTRATKTYNRFNRVAPQEESTLEVTEADVAASKVPVFLMLPLDTVTLENRINERHRRSLITALQVLKLSGVDGVMVDFWWGIVEREPRCYDWSAFVEVVELVREHGLKVSVVLSFHACGSNVGDDSCEFRIPLPSWVVAAAQDDPDLLYTDQHGNRNPECLSLWADGAMLGERTVLACYTEFLASFRDTFSRHLDKTIAEVTVGMGPCGELRYPSYPQEHLWRFPGIGEFQCYDKRALESLRAAAVAAGHPEWGTSGPHDSGDYNSLPHETEFFCANGSWASEYGRFFLEWYSSQLTEHGERMLSVASHVFGEPTQSVMLEKIWYKIMWGGRSGGRGTSRGNNIVTPRNRLVQLNLKCAGVHWWFLSRSHAAELTTGYYNTHERDGYADVVALCAKFDVRLNFTCVEMRDSEHPGHACCSPEGLLRQVRETAAQHNVPFAGENALSRFDRYAYDRIIENIYFPSASDVTVPPMAAFTFLRLVPGLFIDSNLIEFMRFVAGMRDAAERLAVSRLKATETAEPEAVNINISIK